jgi:hypothetical protein
LKLVRHKLQDWLLRNRLGILRNRILKTCILSWRRFFFFFFILSYCVVVLCTWFFKVNWLAFVSTISISFAEKTLLKKKVASRGLCLVLMVEMPGFVFHLLCRWVDFQRLRLFNMNLLGKCYDLRVKVKLLCLLRVEWDINYKCVGWSF